MATMRRTRRIAGIAAAVLVATISVCYVVSWIRTPTIERAAFFASRHGETEPLIFAHQGGETLRPTNTMLAFRHAVALGADVLDTDMQRTSDGVLVLVHDETVDRTSDGTGAVRDLSFDELRQLDFAHSFTTDGGETHPYRDQGHGVVTVEELFVNFPTHRIGIEIKQTPAVAATELCAVIARLGREDDVLVSSFEQRNMDVFRRECPDVATSATEGEVRTFYVLHRLGLVGLSSPTFDAFQVPERSGGVQLLTSGFIDDARAVGVPIVPWTIDDPADLERVLGLGVEGINTNYPDRLADLVR